MYPTSTTAAMYSASKSEMSPAVSRTRCAVPGPLAVWHDAQLVSRIGRTSSAKEIPLAGLATSTVVVLAAFSVMEVVGSIVVVFFDAAELGADVLSSEFVRGPQAVKTIAAPTAIWVPQRARRQFCEIMRSRTLDRNRDYC